MNQPNRKSHTSAPRGGISYLSVCSGIEAASVAWKPLGWSPVAFAEIEKFPAAVLNHHWPTVPNLGDLTKHHEWKLATRPDLIVGGTPCQAFSVAGLRRGLEDPRGNLTLVFLALLESLRPRWVVWENVPGVLSDRTGAFGSLLGGLGQLGYGFAYRVLDAQYFGVPQRRRRVFVVGCLGDWRSAAAVLFEPACLRGDSAPRREAGQEVAGTFKACAGSGGWSNSADHAEAGYMIPEVSKCLVSHGSRLDSETETFPGDSGGGEGFDASEDGTGRGTPLVPEQTAVRRLTPTECERLQGFPDGHTMIPWRGKDADACPDGPRYNALGNSMAVPVMRWIGRRIESIK